MDARSSHDSPSRLRQVIIAAGVCCLSTALYVSAFPPFNIAESAYIFLIPFLLWFFSKPSFKTVCIAALVFGFVSWIILIFWLRHVTLAGTLVLAFVLGLFPTAWLLFSRRMLPCLTDGRFRTRVSAMAGLAAFWVLLEHLRTFLFSGFPWLPLAASQWNRPSLLQILAYTGFYGLSFILIFFNLGLAFYLKRIISRQMAREWWRRLCPELYCAFALLMGAVCMLFYTGIFKQDREHLFRAGAVQPYIQQPDKWDPAMSQKILDRLERLTSLANSLEVDLLLWPESVTPWPIKGEKGIRIWTENQVRKLGTPILMGNMAVEGGNWHNTICAVTPGEGLLPMYYAKRKLVPFGEFVPLQKFLPFLKKIVPISGSFKPGEAASLIPLSVAGKDFRVGSLVCYEDIFPKLSRDSVAAGADFLFVATNNAWYGEEAGAYQHAVHAVLRAVETRRPVIRCGNGGWSGWIDEYGHIRQVLLNPEKGVYFRGADVLQVSRDKAWVARESFYLRHGDWFVGVCLVLALWGWASVYFQSRRKKVS